jgi:TRAP-type mannitol/chloroaromatic compound transport system permease small subunit
MPKALRGIDEISRIAGLIATWLVLVAALVSALNAFIRYSLNTIVAFENKVHFFGGLGWLIELYRNNSNTLGESQWYMFAAMVMLGASWTLAMNEHVRVDLFYGWASEKTRLWIDLLGGIFFLAPMCVLMIYITWPWFLLAWNSGEMSTNAGGLMRWPAKLMLPLGFALLLMQGLAEIAKCVMALFFGVRREHRYEKPLQ